MALHSAYVFLEDFLANKEFDPEIKSLVWSGNHVMSVLQTAKEERGMILPRGMKEEVQIMGAYHRLYVALNRKYDGHLAYKLWNARPKLHMMCHILDVGTGRNPTSQATWMDEDWVKAISTLAKKTHAKKNTIQRFWDIAQDSHSVACANVCVISLALPGFAVIQDWNNLWRSWSLTI